MLWPTILGPFLMLNYLQEFQKIWEWNLVYALEVKCNNSAVLCLHLTMHLTVRAYHVLELGFQSTEKCLDN